MLPYQTVKKLDNMSIRFDTIPELYGQTDGIVKTISRSACIAY